MSGSVSVEGEETEWEEAGCQAGGGRAEDTPRKGVNGRGMEGFIVSVGPKEETECGAEVGACGADEEEEREAKGGTNLREEGGRADATRDRGDWVTRATEEKAGGAAEGGEEEGR